MASYCCDDMRFQIEVDCDLHDDPMECVDCAVVYSPKFREYGLPVRDGPGGSANAVVVIDYCPWCGTKLPASLRDRWFDALESMGVEPEDDAVPAEFKDDRWWRNSGA